MALSADARRAKTQRGKRALLAREPKSKEPAKRLLVLKGHATSQLVGDVLGDLATVKRPHVHRLSRRNTEVLPFQAGKEAGLERLAVQFDCALFALGNHTKKRPHNLVLGRLFDGHVLDMLELGVTNFVPMHTFKGAKNAVDSKPCILFLGELFENDEKYARIKNLFLDFLRGEEVDSINLVMVDHLFTLSADTATGALHLRHYTILLKKAPASSPDKRLPRVSLVESGPALDFAVRRTQFASEDLWKSALRRPKRPGMPTDGGVVPKRRKNVSWDDGLGDTKGRVHLGKQDLGKLALRKTKALKGRGGGEESDDDGLSSHFTAEDDGARVPSDVETDE